MKTALKGLAALIAATAWAAPTAQASHHFETAADRASPAFDLTDIYVFEAATPGHTAFIIHCNPQTSGDGTPGFGADGIYNLHIAADRTLKTGLTLTFRFDQGKVLVGMADNPSPALGEAGKPLGAAPIGQDTRLAGGIRIWAGAARDLFVGNAAGITKFAADLQGGRFNEAAFANAEDFFAALNTSAIVIEIANTQLPAQVQVYATSARQDGQGWRQINRIGHVLLTHLFLLGDETVAGDHVAHRPDDDGQRRYWLSASVTRTALLARAQADPAGYGNQIAERLLPDMIPYRVGTRANYAAAAFNGRRPDDDAMDVALSLFAGKPVRDRAARFDRHPARFPYLIPVGR